MQQYYYKIIDSVEQTVLMSDIPDEITAEIELVLVEAEHPHLDLEIQASITTEQ